MLARRFVTTFGAVLALAAVPVADPAAAEAVRGITISTHTDGRDWASARMTPTMEEIRGIGAGWVAIHPYAGIDADGRVRFSPIDPDDPPAHIVEPIRRAHALGLKILIKPHLAYWGTFRWRGEIEFDTDEAWRRFFDGYERWISSLAAATREADAFAVGTELDRTLHFEDRWRRIVASVRKRTDAPLTYAANWTDFERVTFWDAVDAIGIQAYFPLTEQADADESAIRAGWDGVMARLRAFAERHGRPIVFTELGYNRSLDAPVKPWDYRTDGPEAERVQRTCIRVALEAIEREPAVVGAFLWKWFPQPHPVGRNFQLATPAIKGVIREVWLRR